VQYRCDCRRAADRHVLSDHERTFLLTRRVAHLATADNRAIPHVVPVCFTISQDTLYDAEDAGCSGTPRESARGRLKALLRAFLPDRSRPAGCLIGRMRRSRHCPKKERPPCWQQRQVSERFWQAFCVKAWPRVSWPKTLISMPWCGTTSVAAGHIETTGWQLASLHWTERAPALNRSEMEARGSTSPWRSETGRASSLKHGLSFCYT